MRAEKANAPFDAMPRSCYDAQHPAHAPEAYRVPDGTGGGYWIGDARKATDTESVAPAPAKFLAKSSYQHDISSPREAAGVVRPRAPIRPAGRAPAVPIILKFLLRLYVRFYRLHAHRRPSYMIVLLILPLPRLASRRYTACAMQKKNAYATSSSTQPTTAALRSPHTQKSKDKTRIEKGHSNFYGNGQTGPWPTLAMARPLRPGSNCARKPQERRWRRKTRR